MKPLEYGDTTYLGYDIYNFGSNNYSYGMLPITFNMSEISIGQVAALENIFLNPTAEPDSLNIFALYGTQEQFDNLLKRQHQTWASKKACAEVGGIPANEDRETWNKLHELEDKYYAEFTPWYAKDNLQ